MAKHTSSSDPKPRRQRRTHDQLIAELQAEIVAIRQRQAQQQAKADPALRHTAAAMKAVEKALEATTDATTKKALAEVHSSLGELLAGAGLGRPGPRSTRARSASAARDDLPEALLTYVRNNPGQRGEQIAAALDTDSATMRPAMKRLIADGKIKTAGQKRGMTYTAV